MPRFLKLAVLAAAPALAVAQPAAAAQLINVQFAGSGSSAAAAQSGAAIVGSAGDLWNRLLEANGTRTLVDARGAATGVTLSWQATGAYAGPGAFAGTSVQNLMQGYLYSSTSPISLVLSGLTAGQAYTLHAFTQGDSATFGRSNSVTVNGVTQTTTNSNRASFVQGDNLALFSGRADAQGRIVLSDAMARGEANLNGFQLSAGPVPEPATWAMMIAGFAAVGLAMRRRGAGTAVRTLA